MVLANLKKKKKPLNMENLGQFSFFFFFVALASFQEVRNGYLSNAYDK